MNTPMKLEKTTNYDMFVMNHEQRPVNQTHARRIAASIAKAGFLPSKPIQCYRKNGKLIVVDGHHRLDAAKSVGSAVYYVVEGEDCQSMMAAENMLVRKWAMIDFIRLYAARGISDYIILLSYIEKGIQPMTATAMLSGNAANSTNDHQKVAAGKFKVVSTDQIQKIVRLIDEFGYSIPACTKRPFIQALSRCLCWDGFDFDQFILRIRENADLITNAANADQALIQIEKAYNKRSRHQVALKFNVDNNMKSRKFKAK